MKELLDKISKLKKELDSLSPLKKEREEILWQKFRLEWNFNSNHIEGNTLTYGETELLLKLGDEFRAQNNSLKDVNEMRAHDTAIFIIKDWAKEKDRKLLEKDIREFNQTILVKDYWAKAQTKDGQPTRRLIKVGEYKDQPNHVKLKSGEVFKYAEPHEVPNKMQELMDWYHSDHDEHPLITAAYFHYKFVVIHPFDDGNGRVSRLLMNYHLMMEGYPPLIIRSDDKPNYLYALNQADTGDFNAFTEYLGKQIIWSLETSIKAAKGESITEKDDLYKEIEVWKKKVKSGLPTSPRRKDKTTMLIYDESISKLFSSIVSKANTFKELFLKSRIGKSYKLLTKGNYFGFPHPNKIDGFRKKSTDSLEKIRLDIHFSKPLNKPETTREFASVYIMINLNVFDYTITIDDNELEIKRGYNEQLSDQEMETITQILMDTLFVKVKAITS